MKPYQKYSKVYDFLLSEYDYDGDCDFVESTLTRLGFPKPVRILDIGCGTGEHAIRLSKRGHIVTGIDRKVSHFIISNFIANLAVEDFMLYFARETPISI